MRVRPLDLSLGIEARGLSEVPVFVLCVLAQTVV